MNSSKLSLKKVNNIDRQIKLFAYKTAEIVDKRHSSKHLLFTSGDRSISLRDFYEYYIDEQPLINIISKSYWNTEANEKSEFFNSHIGCLGGFGIFWDQIYVSILTEREFTANQIKHLVDLLKPNYTSSKIPVSNKKIRDQVIAEVRENFLMYCCQDCGDSGCGGITLNIKKVNDKVVWTDNEKIEIHFNTTEYEQVFQNFINMRKLELN